MRRAEGQDRKVATVRSGEAATRRRWVSAAAADTPAIVSRGGRPDLAGDALPLVLAPTLLIVGGHDEPVIELNEEAYARLRCRKEMRIIPGATHLFEEPGTLEQVAQLAAEWFNEHLKAAPQAVSASGGRAIDRRPAG